MRSLMKFRGRPIALVSAAALALSLLPLATVTIVHASRTIVVNTLSEAQPQGQADACAPSSNGQGVCSFFEAGYWAQSGDTITFSVSGTIGSNNTCEGHTHIAPDVTVDGGGTRGHESVTIGCGFEASSGDTIEGIGVSDYGQFPGTGIDIQNGGDNVIKNDSFDAGPNANNGTIGLYDSGGHNTVESDVFYDNTRDLEFGPPNDGNNIVENDTFGTDASGTSAEIAAGYAWETGLTDSGPDDIVKNNLISDGAQLTGGKATIQGNKIGTNRAGTELMGNGGLFVSGSGNTVGGTGASNRNIIADNYDAATCYCRPTALSVSGSGTVQGNYIGVSSSGKSGLGAAGNGISAASNLTIGGNKPDEANFIGGFANGAGIVLQSSDTVEGNIIGLGADQKTVIPNQTGILIGSPTATEGQYTGNVIGGSDLSGSNVIVGSTNAGVEIEDASHNQIGDDFLGVPDLCGSSSCTGTAVVRGVRRARSVSFGNNVALLVLKAGAQPADYNLIGCLPAGTAGALPKCRFPLPGASSELYVGNNETGVEVDGGRHNIIAGVEIGIGSNGLAAPNIVGIQLTDGAAYNKIGGTAVADGNRISANNKQGILIDGSKDNTVNQNWIGLSFAGVKAMSNGFGVDISNGSTGNIIGLPAKKGTQGNVISGNKSEGLFIQNSSDNTVQDNYVGLNSKGTRTVGNHTEIEVQGQNQTSENNTIRDNYVAVNGDVGILLNHASNNSVKDNHVGAGINDTVLTSSPAKDGIKIDGTGSGPSTEANTIDGNDVYEAQTGIAVDTAPQTVISGNHLAPSPHHGSGTLAYGIGTIYSNSATIGRGSHSGSGNVILGASNSGIVVYGGTGTTINENEIDDGATGMEFQRSAQATVGTDGAPDMANSLVDNSDGGIDIGLNSSDADEVAIFANSWSDNHGLGIELAGQGNCATDTHGSPNNFTACPTITSASTSKIAGEACSGCQVMLFVADRASGAYGEGKTYLGTTRASTLGSWSMSLREPRGTVLTAFAIASSMESSEFSRDRAVS